MAEKLCEMAGNSGDQFITDTVTGTYSGTTGQASYFNTSYTAPTGYTLVGYTMINDVPGSAVLSFCGLISSTLWFNFYCFAGFANARWEITMLFKKNS